MMGNLDEAGLARDNHYVPRAQLRRWSPDGRTVWAYRLLVSHPRVPEWRRMSVRSLASQRDLYTVFAGDEEVDAFERWITEAFERPAQTAIDKVARNQRLKREDWQSLAKFVALQDVRTPRGFFDMMRRWERDLPDVLDRTMRESLEQLRRVGASELVPRRPSGAMEELTGLIEVDLTRDPNSDNDGATLRAEMTLGRRSWIAVMRYLLQGPAVRVLCDHMWSIAEAPEGIEWPLTDHPVLKLNYYGPEKYDFGGGWGRRRGNIVMPLTPRHLLFVQIGEDQGRKIALRRDVALLMQRLLLERAHRWIFATNPLEWMSRVRAREVNDEAFEAERAVWEQWHEAQSAAESSPSSR